MNTHTPGPWHAPADKSFYVVAGSGDFAEQHLRDTCNIGPAPVICNASTQANARLIAAAPDLLAALKDVIGLAERGAKAGGDSEMTDLWMRGQIANARRAIAKAEG